MRKGTLLVANESSNTRYGYTNLDYNCTAEFVGYDKYYCPSDPEREIMVRILTCGKNDQDVMFVGHVMSLEERCFDIMKERPVHFISTNIIKEKYENRRKN